MEKEKREVEPKCKHCEYTTKNLTCMKVHCLTQHSTKEKKNLNIIVINVILELTQKYYLHDIVKQRNNLNI